MSLCFPEIGFKISCVLPNTALEWGAERSGDAAGMKSRPAQTPQSAAFQECKNVIRLAWDFGRFGRLGG